MSSLDTNYFSRVRSLFLPYMIAPEPINTDINKYIDSIEGLTEQLERTFSSNTNMFLSVLERIQDMLKKIYAKQHEAYTVTLSRSAKQGTAHFSNKVLQQAIADFLMLSIELQKAQTLPGSSSSFIYSEAEKAVESMRSMDAIASLIDAQDYMRAKSIATDIKRMGVPVDDLLLELERGNFSQARNIATKLRDQYAAKVNQAGSGLSRNKTVLAVDDFPEILSAVDDALRNHFKVLGAPSGQVALEIVNSQDVHLFLLDIEMPSMDGFQLASNIRSNAKHKNTPIIFFTANSSRDRIVRAIRLGISDFIVKPAYNETILSKVKRYIG